MFIRSSEPKPERGQNENVYMPPSLKRTSQKEAVKRKMSWSEFVRTAIRNELRGRK